MYNFQDFVGRSPLNKNLGLKVWKFHVPNWNGTFCLVIVLVSRTKKSGTGDNNFLKWKGTFRSGRPKRPEWSKWTTFKAGPEYSGRTKPKWSVHLTYQPKFPVFWVEWKVALVAKGAQVRHLQGPPCADRAQLLISGPYWPCF